MTLRTRLFPLFAALPLLAGCGGDDGGMVPVTGSVTWEGQPVTTGNVTFTPADGATGARLATGQIQSDGTFAMGTLKHGDGVLPGSYRVAISSAPPPPIEVMEGQKLPTGPVPTSFNDPATSGLEVTIEAGDPVVHDFKLPK
jgi:hypothetical protein